MKIVCVVGARPNFVKAAPVVETLRKNPSVTVKLVHTGQHYDREMSELFFEQLGLPRPDVNLDVGSGSHGEQTGTILIRLEPVLVAEKPDLVMVFGDVNSTVAAALCAVKLGIKVAHVESGLRSFDRSMPEEINRILTDQVSDILFTTEPSARENLIREGISDEKIFFVGNTMVDSLLKHRARAESLQVRTQFGLERGRYGVLTLHRPASVDNSRTLGEILAAVSELGKEFPIVFPCHPRTRERLRQFDWTHADSRRVLVIEPLGYLEFISLMAEARIVLTDSGGIQEETTVLGIPCITLRDNTERPVTVTEGTNLIAGCRIERILAEAETVLRSPVPKARTPEKWDGKAAERVAQVLSEALNMNVTGLAVASGWN